MATASAIVSMETRTPTLGEILDSLDPSLPPGRVVCWPAPGTATAEDVLAIREREGRLCELVDGTLVEKTMGVRESIAATLLASLLNVHLGFGRLGIVVGADGPIRFGPGKVFIPDVAVYRIDRFEGGTMPTDPIWSLVPDLAVEILSPGNTKAEMDRKLREYFDAGVRLVWFADPKAGEVWVHRGVDEVERVDASGAVDGGEVLPGFSARVSDWLR